MRDGKLKYGSGKNDNPRGGERGKRGRREGAIRDFNSQSAVVSLKLKRQKVCKMSLYLGVFCLRPFSFVPEVNSLGLSHLQ